MLRYNQKTGDLSLAPSALGFLVFGVCGFATWMTKMQYDVMGWNVVSDKVSKIERILIYNHLDAPISFGVPTWPGPSPYSPYWPALASSPAVAMKRE